MNEQEYKNSCIDHDKIKELEKKSSAFENALNKISKVNAKTEMRYIEKMAEELRQCKMIACNILKDYK